MPKSDKPERLVDDFIHHLQYARGYSDHTLCSYRVDLEQFVKFLEERDELGGFPEHMTRLNIRAFLAHLSENSYAKSSVARKLASLRTFFKHLVKNKVLEDSPLRGIRTPKLDCRVPRCLTDEQLQRLLYMYPRPTSLYELRDDAVIWLLAMVGMRLSELAGLDKTDLEGRNLKLRGKGRKERTVVLVESAFRPLATYLVKLDGYQCPDHWPKDEPAMFTNGKNGGRLTARSICRIVDKRAQQVKLGAPVSPGRLRNTLTRRLVKDGYLNKDACSALGYAAESSTLYALRLTFGR